MSLCTTWTNMSLEDFHSVSYLFIFVIPTCIWNLMLEYVYNFEKENWETSWINFLSVNKNPVLEGSTVIYY